MPSRASVAGWGWHPCWYCSGFLWQILGVANRFHIQCRDFPEELQGLPHLDLSLRHRPSWTLGPDPIWTRFQPEITLFGSESGRNRVEIRGPCSSSGKSPLECENSTEVCGDFTENLRKFWGNDTIIRSRPGKANQRKSKTKSSSISPIFVNSGVFPWKTSAIHSELWFQFAPRKSSWTSLGIPWTWYRSISGRRDENGRKMDLGLAWKMGKNGPENEKKKSLAKMGRKWSENGIAGHFSLFFGPCFPHSSGEAKKSIFRPFSSPFRAGGQKWIYTRSTGFQTQWHCIVRCGCNSDTDSNRAMPTARETSKTQTLRNTGPFFFPHFSLLVVGNWSWKCLNEGNFTLRFENAATRVPKSH